MKELFKVYTDSREWDRDFRQGELGRLNAKYKRYDLELVGEEMTVVWVSCDLLYLYTTRVKIDKRKRVRLECKLGETTSIKKLFHKIVEEQIIEDTLGKKEVIDSIREEQGMLKVQKRDIIVKQEKERIKQEELLAGLELKKEFTFRMGYGYGPKTSHKIKMNSLQGKYNSINILNKQNNTMNIFVDSEGGFKKDVYLYEVKMELDGGLYATLYKTKYVDGLYRFIITKNKELDNRETYETFKQIKMWVS